MAPSHPRPQRRPWCVGCVSFLNARPLIEGLADAAPDQPLQLRLDVPSALLADLEAGQVDIALCPVIDYYRSRRDLTIVPVGAIGSAGPTLTVKLASRVPIDRIDTVHADTDSHTSVALLQVVLHARHGRRPHLVAYNAREQTVGHRLVEPPESVLLIGDKVVTPGAGPARYPHELDLGEAWHDLTGLPFVFAAWMARSGARLGPLPAMLAESRARGLAAIDRIVRRDAPPLGWPADLARHYLGSLLRYDIGPPELRAIEHFARLAHALGLIDAPRPLRCRPAAAATAAGTGP